MILKFHLAETNNLHFISRSLNHFRREKTFFNAIFRGLGGKQVNTSDKVNNYSHPGITLGWISENL